MPLKMPLLFIPIIAVTFSAFGYNTGTLPNANRPSSLHEFVYIRISESEIYVRVDFSKELICQIRPGSPSSYVVSEDLGAVVSEGRLKAEKGLPSCYSGYYVAY